MKYLTPLYISLYNQLDEMYELLRETLRVEVLVNIIKGLILFAIPFCFCLVFLDANNEYSGDACGLICLGFLVLYEKITEK